MPELEDRIRAVRPEWPTPPAALEERILGAMGLADSPPRVGARPSAWLSRGMHSRRTRMLVVGAVLAGSGAALAVALVGRGGTATTGERASLAFGSPELVGDVPGFDTALDAAVDDEGRVAVVWTRAGRVVVSTRPAGGGWSTPARLSDPARRAAYPRIGADSAGRFTVIWRERIPGRRVSRDLTLPDGSPAGTLEGRVGTRWQIAGRTADPQGRWGDLERVSEPTGTLRAVYRPQLSVAASGVATAVFAADGRAWASRRSPDGTWEAEPIGATAGSAVDLDLQGDRASGRVVATWQARVVDPVAGPQWRAWASVGGASGSWSSPHELGQPGTGKRRPAAAIGRDGDAVVAWAEEGFVATVRGASGDWSAPETVIATPGPDFETQDRPAVGVDGRGVAALAGVLWRIEPFPGGFSGTATPPWFVRREADGWGPRSRIGGGPTGLSIVPDSAGGLVVLTGSRGRAARAQLHPIAPDGTPGATRTAPAGILPARIAVGDEGTSVLVGTRQGPDDGRLQVVAAVAPAGGS